MMKIFILFSILGFSQMMLAQSRVLSRSQMSNQESLAVNDEDTSKSLLVDISYLQGSFTLDVINEFANQLRSESQDYVEQKLHIKYFFTDSFYVYGNYSQSEVDYESSPQYDLEKSQLDYFDWNTGFGYDWETVGLRLAYGERKYHTFLETDTTYYFHDELKSNYILAGVDYRFETAFFFDVEMFYDFNYYLPSKLGDYSIERGEARRWGGRLVFGGDRMKFGAGYQRTHINIKMNHDLYGLKNEMSNKVLANQFFVFGSYQF